ncbi:MAG: spore maturation protein [Ruminiclostridium sp.]|nr:spore maturation protein [Ruminiclostridium sp.]
MSDYIVPVMIAAVLIYGAVHRTDVFAEFTEGVKEGLRTVYDIFPSLFCLVVTVGAFRASGAAEVITELLSPVLDLVGFPAECGTLLILRPFSGSGSIAVFESILADFGPDSFPGRVASVILGSSETTFYTLSVYFAAVKAKKTRYALAAALIGDLTCALISAASVNLILQ